MDPTKRQTLEAAECAVGNASDFLELTPEEEEAIDAAIEKLPMSTTHVEVIHSPLEGDPLRIEITITNAHVYEPPIDIGYLQDIPGMAESIQEGLATPIEECSTELDWGY